MAEESVKAKALRLIEQLPDDATWEDIDYAIYVRSRIEAGLKDSREGRGVPLEDVRRLFDLSRAQRSEIARRLKAYRANPDDVIPWEDVWDEAERRFGGS